MYVIVGIKLACDHRLSVMIVGKSCDELRTTTNLFRQHKADFSDRCDKVRQGTTRVRQGYDKGTTRCDKNRLYGAEAGIH